LLQRLVGKEDLSALPYLLFPLRSFVNMNTALVQG